jgi:hypothetical protein
MKAQIQLGSRTLLFLMVLLISFSSFSQVIMFDDFNYTSINDPQLPVFNKWNIIDGVSGPPEGGVYSRNNISFINDPANSSNRLMTLSTTVDGQSDAVTHSRIETGGFEYFTGTYAARVYLSDVPFTYKDANIQTFYTIVSSSLASDGSKYSELDIVEYMAADKWGTSTDNRVLYTTSYHKYIPDPWAAWKTYFASVQSYAGWHTFIASCTDGVNVKYWIDNTYLGAQAYTDGNNPDGATNLPVYPRSNMQVAFANWVWNNVIGTSTANRTTTMQADWVLHYKNQELSLAQINTLVSDYRTQGLKRRNLAGQTYFENPCTVPAQPGSISGNTTVAAGSSQTYSIAAVSGATSYTWTLPSGWSGSSASTSITTTVGSAGGTISVVANNSCGSGTARTLSVTVNTCNVPAQPGNISGNTNVTGGSSQTYSIAAVSGATTYTWTLPSGWSGSSTTTSITATAGSAGGTISVRANNSCGAGTARTLSVTVGSSSTNLAINKPVTVSSTEAAGLEGNKAVDNNLSTRWASAYSDAQWIYVDLGANYNVNRVKITWEAAYGRNYQVQVSANASSWTTIKTISDNTALVNDHTGLSGTGRYVRMNGTLRGTAWGYSIFEFEVYGTPASGGFTTRVEAESYTFMAGVVTETCSEGGLNVGSFDTNDWTAYNITIPSTGSYRAHFRVSSIYSGRTLRFEKDNGATLLATVTVPNTASWQTWTTVSQNVTLPTGTYSVGLTTFTGGLNINWFEITDNLSSRSATGPVALTEEGEEIMLYPNPVKATLRMKGIERFKGGQMKIVDASGREFLAGKIDRDDIDVSSLTPGLYILNLSKDTRFFSRKFLKE